MEYLVHTSGEVSTTQRKTYVVSAPSQQEAQDIAIHSFQAEFDCVRVDVEAQSFTRTKNSIAACVFMLIAIIISLFSFPYHKTFLFFSIPDTFSIAPQPLSSVFSIIFYSIFVIRFKGIRRSVGSVIDISFTILSVLLLSSVFQSILTAKNLRLLGFIPVPDPKIILIIAIAASLLGVKLVSAGCMVFIAIAAVSNLDVAGQAMGFWGVLYIMCAFIGILLYLSVEPAVLEALPQIKNSFSKTSKHISNDFTEAKKEAKSLVDAIPK